MELESSYEISEVAEFIRCRSFTRVAIQFPDELLKDSLRVVNALRREIDSSSVKLYVMADTTYGSCCVDEVGAAHINAECVIHYGHTCLSKTTKIPALFVFGKASISISDCATNLASCLMESTKPVLVLFGLECAHAIPRVREALASDTQGSASKLEPLIYADICSAISNPSEELEPFADDFQGSNEMVAEGIGHNYKIGGLRWLIPEGQKMEDYLILWIGSDNTAFANVVLTFNRCEIVRYDATESCLVRDISQQSKILKRRYYLVEKAKDANMIGILVGTLGTGMAFYKMNAGNSRGGHSVRTVPNRTEISVNRNFGSMISGTEYRTELNRFGSVLTEFIFGFLRLFTEIPRSEEKIKNLPKLCSPLLRRESRHLRQKLLPEHIICQRRNINVGRFSISLQFAVTSHFSSFIHFSSFQGCHHHRRAGYLQIIHMMKDLISKAGKKSYIFVMGKPNPAKLANFPECDVFIHVSCAQTALLDSKDFLAPIITPFEAILAFERGRQWTGEYGMEFRDLISSTTPTKKEQNEEARFSFLHGGYVEDLQVQDNEGVEKDEALALVSVTENALKIRDGDHQTASNKMMQAKTGAEYFARRSYHGLDIIANGQNNENNDSTPGKVLAGRSGKASGYKEEMAQTSS